MSEVVIKVENLGKRYLIRHEQREHYTALRDVLTRKFKSFGKKLISLQSYSSNLQPSREEFWALKDISFEVKQGDRVGIIGRNGAGKTTLLKLLSRITEPTIGRMRIIGRVASLLEVGTGFHPELTGRENIFLNGAILGMRKVEIKRKFDEIVDFAEIEKFLDTPVKRYSSGMYVRLAFAVAAHLEPDILLVDEVLAVGDAAFQTKCMGKMEKIGKQGRTVLFVSHNMESIRKLCPNGLYLNNGNLVEIRDIDAIISNYLSTVHQIEGNVISFDDTLNCDYFIERIEVLNMDGTPKDKIQTWDTVRFRIVFYSNTDLKAGSVVFQISTLSGVTLSLCSTQPDHAVIIEFKRGFNKIDCIFPKLMLSAGKYLIGAGLAVPNAQWLYKNLQHSVINVYPRDIYNSGLAPHTGRYFIPQEHIWEVVC